MAAFGAAKELTFVRNLETVVVVHNVMKTETKPKPRNHHGSGDINSSKGILTKSMDFLDDDERTSWIRQANGGMAKLN
jgi:hypothetical protein